MPDNPPTLPTADAFFGISQGNLPTASEFFGQAQQAPEVPSPSGWVKPLSNQYTQQGPYEGPESDHLFSSNTEAARVLNAIGVGFKQGWGSAGQSLYQSEIEKEARDKDEGILKGAVDAWMKPVAAAVDTITHLPLAIGGAVSAGLGQTGREIGGPIGELMGEAAEGALPEGGVPETALATDHMTQLHQARAEGVIGEGEEGYFRTQKVSEENLEERQAAAKAAGKPQPGLAQEKPNVPDIHTLARQVDPDTFKQYDRLLDTQENLRLTRTYLEGQLEGPESAPQNQKILGNLGDIRSRLQDIDLQLRDLIPATSAAKNRVQELLGSESPEGAAYRDYVQAQAFENAVRLQELSPDVTRAYGHAEQLLSTDETGPEGETGKPSGASQKPQEGQAAGSAIPGTEEPGSRPGGPPRGSKTNETSVVSPEAIEKGLRENFEGQPEFQGVSYKDESQKAKALVDSDQEKAIRVALGQEDSPGIHPQAVLRAVKELAYNTKDTKLMEDLASSPLNKHASQAGQTLSLRRGIFDFDPVNLLSQLNESLRNAAGGLKADARIEGITRELQDRLAKFDENWAELLSQISCPE